MKLPQFLSQPAGVVVATLVIATCAVSAYAAANWFNGTVTVSKEGSVLTVDLSTCKDLFLPGFDLQNLDRTHVQFKTLSKQHISQEDLQRQLLAQCEFDSVKNFYAKNDAPKNAGLYPSKVVAISSQQAMLTYVWGGKLITKMFTIAGASFYNQGQTATLSDIRAGDTVVFVTPQQKNVTEGADPLEHVADITSIFKTQYDTNDAPNVAKKSFYDSAHIMPLDAESGDSY